MEPARHLVAVVVEFSPGVQHGEDDFGGRSPALVTIHRDPAAVVDHGHRTVDVHGDVHLIAVAGQCLVNRVVDDLVHQVVQPGGARRSDVHGGALANSLEAFKDLDFVRTVFLCTRAVAIAGAAGCRVGGRGGNVLEIAHPAIHGRRALLVVGMFEL